MHISYFIFSENIVKLIPKVKGAIMEEKIGFRVKQARLNAGLTQEELAEKANMSSSFISRLENGKILPSIKKLLMLADIMNVGLEDLLRDFFRHTGEPSDALTEQIFYQVDMMTVPEKQYLLSFVESFNNFMDKR
ncbi:DNA-binding helix-turn-helix protein [[Clostridium] hylemonae DSM 15053]|uniref:DNA-binding helix-turn-helix protein n=2 Tax=[Clostridium] hylemonae TaxID=89153 RepID=C0C566_9FIRM|nr:DNA-binding helix-turn-helix protein [[Clostridium] hylemonae DSM 15053]